MFRDDYCSFLKEIQVILRINNTLDFDRKREKEKTIRMHTKLRRAVYSNSLAMNNQKMGVIMTRNDATTFRFQFFNKLARGLKYIII